MKVEKKELENKLKDERKKVKESKELGDWEMR